MASWYKRLDRITRILMHAACISIIIAIPTIYRDSSMIPILPSVIWSISLFSECLLVLLGHKVKMDASSSDNHALKRIMKMEVDEKRNERKRLLSKLEEMVIPGPGIKLLENEKCLYRGEAEVIYDPDFLRYYLGDLCPEELEEDEKKSSPGLLYITTRRVIMMSAFHSFKLDYEEILQAQHTANVLFLLQKCDAVEVYTKEMKKIIEVFNLLNQLSMTKEDEMDEDMAKKAI